MASNIASLVRSSTTTLDLLNEQREKNLLYQRIGARLFGMDLGVFVLALLVLGFWGPSLFLLLILPPLLLGGIALLVIQSKLKSQALQLDRERGVQFNRVQALAQAELEEVDPALAMELRSHLD